MNILITLLGLAPGVATGAYYALARDRQIPVDRLVTLTTIHPQVGDCEREIERELARWQADQGVSVQYEEKAVLYQPEPDGALRAYRASLREQMADACRLRVPYEDVNDEQAVAVFREAILTLVRDVYRNDNVYLCVAGGRKSMAAIAAIAAQLYGYSVKELFHLFVKDDIEKDGSLDTLPFLPDERKRRVLRPTPDEVQLVSLPFFQVIVQEGQPRMVLRGDIKEYVVEYLRENPEVVTLLTPESYDSVLGYVFEIQVCNYLRRQGYSVEHSARLPGLVKGEDIDAYGERAGETLLCECQMRADPAQPIKTRKVEQIIKRVTLARGLPLRGRLRGWIASNATALDKAAEQWKLLDDCGDIEVMHFPLRKEVLRNIEGRNYSALLRERWFAEDRIQPLARL